MNLKQQLMDRLNIISAPPGASLVDDLIDCAERQILAGGDVEPMIIAEAGALGFCIRFGPWTHDEPSKDMVVRFGAHCLGKLEELAARPVERLAVVMEAWMFRAKSDEEYQALRRKHGPSIADLPGRVEILHVLVETPTSQLVRSRDILRHADGTVGLAPAVEVDNAAGRFAGLLYKGKAT